MTFSYILEAHQIACTLGTYFLVLLRVLLCNIDLSVTVCKQSVETSQSTWIWIISRQARP